MNCLTLQIIIFTSDQIYITAVTSGYTLIVPEGATAETSDFILDTYSGNVSWYP